MTSLATPPARTEAGLTNEELEAIRQFDACTLSNAIETFGVRLANEGFADASIRCFAAGRIPMLGYAVTARVQGSAVPITGQRYGDRPGWWEYLLALPGAARGGAAGYERAPGIWKLPRRGPLHDSYAPGLRRRRDQRGGPRSSRGRSHGVCALRRNRRGIALLPSPGGFRYAGGGWRSAGFSRRPYLWRPPRSALHTKVNRAEAS